MMTEHNPRRHPQTLDDKGTPYKSCQKSDEFSEEDIEVAITELMRKVGREAIDSAYHWDLTAADKQLGAHIAAEAVWSRLNATIKSRSSETTAYEDYIAVECGDDGPKMITSYPIHWRWSDHQAVEEWLEVQTVDGWQAVYPIVSRKCRG